VKLEQKIQREHWEGEERGRRNPAGMMKEDEKWLG